MSINLEQIASVCLTGWKAIPISKAFSFMYLHITWIIAAVAIIDRMVAINRKISIIILSKIKCLMLFLFIVFNICPFCLCWWTRFFGVFGAFNYLESNSDVCSEIGNTCSCVVQFWEIWVSKLSVKLSK